MRQLSALDAQFLNFETDTNVANVGGLAILDGTVSRTGILALLEERLPAVPQLRRRLALVPLGLDHPYWAEDAEVDLDYHVRELALPPPGDDRQLGEQVARIHERRLDRTRPLWEMYVIQGLAVGRSAVYTKLHHAAVDGLTGAEVLAALMDPVDMDSAGPVPKPEPQPPPTLWRMLARTAMHAAASPLRLLRFAGETLPVLDQLPVVSRVPGARLLSGMLRTRPLPPVPEFAAPPTPFSGPVSAHRRFVFAELSLAAVKQVKDACGVTVNDVVMALAAAAVRQWLVDHGALPDRPLVAGVPFSLRGKDSRRGKSGDGPGNQVTIMLTTLATHIADARERLAAVSTGMRAVKERFELTPARWLEDLTESLPEPVNGLADRTAFELVGQTMPPVNVVVSNVPGPQFPLSVAGVRLLAHYPVSVITDVSGGLNITAFSYDGHLDVGIIADRDLVPDVWRFPGYLRAALDELRDPVTAS
ncbi:WS/DGAT/MGAT family O-acyltransferase [Thermoactinospora rubra]|uniref:WS/DGAT/MGAT family O-acyltransferase n=1 Tax=Thermoactinospora rubra TaxID=1088767 RepID=UPI000A11ADE8|nr:wax ester/triacylglycerol synthase family O-acyltransferase [Thermoactinospora rubra]